MAPDPTDTTVTVLNHQRAQRVDRGKLAEFMHRLVGALPPRESSDVVVCLLSDRRVRELNRRFRDRDVATDVLAFPGGDAAEPDGRRHLGDIAISVPTAAKQARVAGHDLQRELSILALHGYLHLLGHDHESDDGRMLRLQRSLERQLLARRRLEAAPAGEQEVG